MSEMKADCKEFDYLENAIDYSKALVKEGYSVTISPNYFESVIAGESKVIGFYVYSSPNKYRELIVTEKTTVCKI